MLPDEVPFPIYKKHDTLFHLLTHYEWYPKEPRGAFMCEQTLNTAAEHLSKLGLKKFLAPMVKYTKKGSNGKNILIVKHHMPPIELNDDDATLNPQRFARMVWTVSVADTDTGDNEMFKIAIHNGEAFAIPWNSASADECIQVCEDGDIKSKNEIYASAHFILP